MAAERRISCPRVIRSYVMVANFIAFCLLTSCLMVLRVCANDKDALLAFMQAADPAHQAITWHAQSQDHHCTWSGVKQCDQNGSVVMLTLQSVNLKGTIIPDLFFRLDKLRILNLQRNSLSGSMPDLSAATNLHTLTLDHNNLSGAIPTSLGDLPNLRMVGLSHNQLAGSIPDLPNFKTMKHLDLSYNNFTGQIPLSLSAMNVSSFAGNLDLCGRPVDTSECKTGTPISMSNSLDNLSNHDLCTSSACSAQPPTKSKKHYNAALNVIVVVGLVLVLGILYLHRRNRSRDMKGGKAFVMETNIKESKTGKLNSKNAQEAEEEQKAELVFFEANQRKFELCDLLRASAEILGKGMFGTTYKALVENGLTVVVKRLTTVSDSGRKPFESHMALVGRLQHPCILPVRACYYGKEEKLLLYDYHPNGSLFAALHSGNNENGLDWMSRFRVACAVAEGLDYIHSTEIQLHGNLKSSNIILTSDNRALIADFGLAPLLSNTHAQSYTAAYLAPECRTNNRKTLLPSADIYSYGVLLLELLTGKLPLQFTRGWQGVDLPQWVESVVREEWTAEVFDRNVKLGREGEDELVSLLRLGMACVSKEVEQRPSMQEVIRVIDEEARSLQKAGRHSQGSLELTAGRHGQSSLELATRGDSENSFSFKACV